MHELAGLIREFPEGSFFIIVALIWGVVMSVRAIAFRNRPTMNCNCECCVDDEEEEDEE